MAERRRHSDARHPRLPSLPLSKDKWAVVALGLGLSPQQVRVVEMILRGMRDKQVAAALNLTVPTVRSHLGRVFARVGVADRVELVLRVFAESEAAGWGTGDGRGRR